MLKLIKYIIIVILNIVIIYYHNKLILLDNRAFELLGSNIRLNYNVLHPLAVLITTVGYNVYKEMNSEPKRIIHFIYICIILFIMISAWIKGLDYLKLTLLIFSICAITSNDAIENI